MPQSRLVRQSTSLSVKRLRRFQGTWFERMECMRFHRWAARIFEVNGLANLRFLGLEGLEDRQFLTVDTVSPFVQSITRTNPASSVAASTPVTFTATFSESVTGVDTSDFALAITGGTTGVVAAVTPISGTVYTITVGSITGNGTLGLNLVDNNTIRDVANNPLATAGSPASFSAQTTYAAGKRSERLAIADVNGDGQPDVIIANNGSDTVSVFLGIGNGSFQAQATFATAHYPLGVAISDLNGDGKPDIVTANDPTDNMSVLLGNGNGTFQTQKTFATGTRAYSVAIADVNSDGKPDAIVANRDSNNVSVLLGNGNGTFNAQTTFAVGTTPRFVAIADVNGDGKPDVIAANSGGGTVSVLLGNGNGTFQAQSTFAASSNSEGVAISDVNSDGKSDLIVTNSSAVSVLLGNGNGTFQVQTTTAVGANPRSVAVADVNGDGSLDLITANSQSNNVSVLLGNGNGLFQTQTTFATGNFLESVALTDVNGDGRPDVITANRDSKTMSVLLNAVNGNFTGEVYTVNINNAPVITTNGGGASASSSVAENTTAVTTVTATDADLPAQTLTFSVSGGADAAKFSINILSGVLTFTIAPNFEAPTDSGANNIYDLIVQVSDGTTTDTQNIAVSVTAVNDNAPVITSNGGGASASISVVENTTAITTVTATDADLPAQTLTYSVSGGADSAKFTINSSSGVLTFSSAPHFASPTDSGANNVYDLVVQASDGTNSDTQNIAVTVTGVVDTISPFVQSINRTNPAGTVANSSPVTFTATFSEPVTGVDTNDFAIALTGGATGVVTAVTPVSGTVYTITVGSITGNGTLGLNLVDNNTIRDLANNPLANPGSPAAFSTQTTFVTGNVTTSVELADVNGDGKLDVVAANASTDSNSVSVLLGNGDGTFLGQTTFATGINPRSFAIADVNGDAKADVVVANFISGTVSVLLGNGNGTLQAQVTFVTGGRPGSVAIADVNGDGKPDIVVANFYDNDVSVLLGNGNGSFQTQTTFAAGSSPWFVAIADVNGDEKPDIVVTNRGGNNVSVLLGNANGTFQVQTTFATGNTPLWVEIADVNSDGSPDLITANTNSDTVGVLLGNGNGSFQAQTTFAVGGTPYSVAIADVNGDGKLDIIVPNRNPSTVSVLLGNGNGTFQPRTTFAPAIRPYSVAVNDVNGDGRPDVVTANGLGNSVSVLLNAVNGNFTGEVYTIQPSNAAPTDILLSASSLNEGLPAGTTVGAFSSADQNAGNTFAYTLASGTGSADNASFTIDGFGILKTTATFQFANKSSHAIRVRTTDQGGLSFEKQFTIIVLPVNDQPSFTAAAPPAVNEDAGSVSIANWATFNPGGGNDETTQTATYNITAVSNPALFSVPPSAAADGTLAYTPAANGNGTSSFTVSVTDSGGTSPGVDTSAEQTFTITVIAVNDAPSFQKGPDIVALTGTGAFSQPGWATDISAGPANESSQTLFFALAGFNAALFTVQPAIDPFTGTLTFTPAAKFFATTITATLRDNGGTSNGGGDSFVQTFTIATSIRFGTVNGIKNVKAIVPDADGTNGTFRLTGNGTGTLVANFQHSYDLTITGADAKSMLKILTDKGGDDAFDLSSITIDDASGDESLGKVDAKTTNLNGDLLVTGTIGSISLANITGPNTFTIGGPVTSRDLLTISVGRITDLSINSATPIKSLSAIDWNDADGTVDTITTPWIGTVTVAGSKTDATLGNFEADLILSGVTAPKGFTLGKFTAVGSLVDSVWSISAGSIGTLTVGRTIQLSTVRTAGNIGAITTGAIVDSTIFAGVADGVTTLPTAFANPSATIASLTVKGLTSAASFTRSLVAAGMLTKVSLKVVDPVSGSGTFGFAADKVKSYSRTGLTKALANLDTANSNNDLTLGGNYVLRTV